MKLAILLCAAGLMLAAPAAQAADPAAMVYMQIPFGDVSATRSESATFGLKLGVARRDQDPLVTHPMNAPQMRSSVDLPLSGDTMRNLNLRGINLPGAEGRPLAFRGAGDSAVGSSIGPAIATPERAGDGLRLDSVGDPRWGADAPSPQ